MNKLLMRFHCKSHFRLGLDSVPQHVCVFLCESHALFIGPVNTDFSKINFKTGSHGTIHTFKNYFVTIFLVFSNKRYPNRLLVLCD